MQYTLSLTIVLTALAVGGCGESKGEIFAKGVCDCYTAAAGDAKQGLQCLQKQTADQSQLNGEPKEAAAYLRKLSTCSAFLVAYFKPRTEPTDVTISDGINAVDSITRMIEAINNAKR